MSSDRFEIDEALHEKYLRRLEQMKASHPTHDATTKAAYLLVFFDPADPSEPVFEVTCYNGQPQALKPRPGERKSVLRSIDQLLDTDRFRDQYGADEEPAPKMAQASPTAHSEALAQMRYIPQIKEYLDKGIDLVSIGYVNQDPCPRCAACMSLGGLDAIVVHKSAKNGDYSKRRPEYVEMSDNIFKKGGVHLFKDDERPVFDRYTEEKPHPRHNFTGIFLGTTSGKDEKFEKIDAYQESEFIGLNEWTDYVAVAEMTKNPDIFGVSIGALPPGISVTEYERTLKKHDTKYSHVVPPITALLIEMQAHGINPADLTIRTSNTPAMRDIVNALAAGVRNFDIPVTKELHDQIFSDEPVSGKIVIDPKRIDPNTGGPAEYHVYNQTNAFKALRLALQGNGLDHILKFNIRNDLDEPHLTHELDHDGDCSCGHH